MIEFAYPGCFILLLLPFIVYWFTPPYKEQKQSIFVPHFQGLVIASGKTPQSGAVILVRKRIQILFVVVGWICVVTALAKPEMVGPVVTQEKSARDLMIAVDLSGSMAVEDFVSPNGKAINRLMAVKSVLTEFAAQREHDRLGLILFGDSPYLQAPFTEDLDTWITLLEQTEIGMAGQSTAFGDAIGLSISIFKQAQTKNRVLIVLTDGNDTASKVPPIEAAKVAASENIKIYTIAMGDPTAIGEEKVETEVLQTIADQTGGEFYQAMDREQLQLAYQKINELELELFDSQSFRPKTSMHHYPIIVFFGLYLIALGIVGFRTRQQIKFENEDVK